ncbi:hypothetical protein AO721_04490 [Aeromonas veronii]|uniref:hypothetical protein n=1 Tax=Aeromonas veronii TaxID=654 RepID=UPI00071891FC|nr:hypothetical protein [Aeromonas veronii]KRV69763.1 hypothetical protein AO728_03695 [Aeromonas veronii]KRV78708.1 hypothetical protein AO719_04305 [Aeromonas veronii]KRV89911.1 hypothetical protein AO721_04490 [Aeromonas veronii]KRV91646.1 hypothetical protein AO739_03760 [Aeromonas veronii]
MQILRDILTFLQQSGLLGILLVLIGWRVVYHNAKRLATRSETKGFVDDLMKLVSDMEKSAVDYWLAGRKERTEPRNYEMLMLAKLSLLNQKMELLSSRKINVDKVIEQIGLLQDGMLLDCERADQMSLDERIEKANEVLACGKTIQTSLYLQFITKYPPQL